MATRLIIDGNAVYEIDEDYRECQQKRNGTRNRGGRTRCANSGMEESCGQTKEKNQ